jgi:hypothetical protein
MDFREVIAVEPTTATSSSTMDSLPPNNDDRNTMSTSPAAIVNRSTTPSSLTKKEHQSKTTGGGWQLGALAEMGMNALTSANLTSKLDTINATGLGNLGQFTAGQLQAQWSALKEAIVQEVAPYPGHDANGFEYDDDEIQELPIPSADDNGDGVTIVPSHQNVPLLSTTRNEKHVADELQTGLRKTSFTGNTDYTSNIDAKPDEPRLQPLLELITYDAGQAEKVSLDSMFASWSASDRELVGKRLLEFIQVIHHYLI